MASLRAVTAAVAVAAVLAGCASGPRGGSGARAGRDGPDANPPANLGQVPNAEPRTETIRSGGANKPYVVLGRGYTPMDANASYRESGLASWYGRKFDGASTSSGEPYDMYAMTAAHPTLPIPSYAWVRNPANGREIIVRINDRGPFHEGRIIDLSYTAAYKLDLLRGVAPVEVERITPLQIASGSWRRSDGGTAFAQAQVAVPTSAVAPAAYVPPPQSLTIYTPPAPATQDSGFVAVPLAVSERSADQDVAAPPRDVIVTTLPSLPSVAPAAPLASGDFWVQLGAFSRSEGAASLARRAGPAASGATVSVLQDGALNRVQAGPFASREAARDAASRLGEALQLAPVIVERR